MQPTVPPCTWLNPCPVNLTAGLCVVLSLLFLLPLRYIRDKSCDFLPSVFLFLLLICCKRCQELKGSVGVRAQCCAGCTSAWVRTWFPFLWDSDCWESLKSWEWEMVCSL